VLPLLPTPRLAALVAVAGVTFLVWTPLALAVNLLLLGLLLREGWSLLRAPAPEVERQVPSRLELDDEARVEVSFEGRAGTLLHWTDDPGPGLERLPPTPGRVRLGGEAGWGEGGGTASDGYLLRGRERGPTEVGDLHLRVSGPLDLLRRPHRVVVSHPVTVQPGLRALRERRLPGLHARVQEGVHRERFRDGGREFARLREYVRGDDPRRVDWKATARKGHLVVREYEAERSQNLVLVVDAGRLMTEGVGARTRLDHALGAALLLADAARARGDQVGVLVVADTVQAWLPPGHHPLSRLADLLARVEGRPVEPDYPEAFRILGRELRRRSLLVIFTDVVDPGTSRPLLAHLARSARQHLPLLVALRNTALDAVAHAPAARVDDAWRRAAAEELLEERDVALRGLRRRGVLVADVDPAEVLTRVLERYAEVKRRGLL
jgi:uncharacterized protein (DUF58 family)